jgi:hypothetical protein
MLSVMLLNLVIRSSSTESSNIATFANVHYAAAGGDGNNTVMVVGMMIKVIMVAVICL